MNKASGGDEIPDELFQILKDDAVKVLHSICQNMENSAVATGLEKISFHSSPKEGQCQGMFKLPHSCAHFMCQQNNPQDSPSQASTSTRTMNFQMYNLNLEKAEEPEIKLPTSAGSWKKAREFQKNIYFCFIDYAKAFDCLDHNKLWKILKETGIPDHLTCLLRNLYAGQEATVRTRHGTMDWFQIREEVRQGCILLPFLFNLYADYIM